MVDENETPVMTDDDLRSLGLKRTTAYVKDAKTKTRAGNAQRQERHRQRVAAEQSARDAELNALRAEIQTLKSGAPGSVVDTAKESENQALREQVEVLKAAVRNASVAVSQPAPPAREDRCEQCERCMKLTGWRRWVVSKLL